MGNIGEPRRQIEFEPLPESEPVKEPNINPGAPVEVPAEPVPSAA